MGKVKIGVGFSISRAGIPGPDEICTFAERVEELGIDSIWPSDHVVSRQPSLDVACLMALFAARTRRIKMGPSVLSLPARDPIHVAKTYASLDHLTGGRRRVIMAVGLGGDPRECTVSGIPENERGARMREGVEVMRKLWSAPNVTHQGRFYRFENVTIEPRPVGGPLDVWIGGQSDLALKRVARYGDGWMPSFITAREFAAGMAKLTAYGADLGRTIEPGEAGVLLLTHVSRDAEAAREAARKLLKRGPIPQESLDERSAIGTVDDVVARLRTFVDAGCTKFILFPLAPAGELIPQIELVGTEILPRFS
ncbi:LLM class flavin-dependent oxidoreductase [Candidatus Binatia bacterium]|nr:LLM class flavin-dependent oxidoreductase [Candidatus Binatia bacterium]